MLRRLGENQHLLDRLAVDAKIRRSTAAAHAVDHHGAADLLIKFHSLHPPPPPKSGGLAGLAPFYPGDAGRRVAPFIAGVLMLNGLLSDCGLGLKVFFASSCSLGLRPMVAVMVIRWPSRPSLADWQESAKTQQSRSAYYPSTAEGRCSPAPPSAREAGPPFCQALVSELARHPTFRYHNDPLSLQDGRSESRNTRPVKRASKTKPEDVCIH